MSILQKFWWILLLKGIILILLAIFVFRHPVGALVGVALYIGISLLITGIMQSVIAVSSKDVAQNWGWSLAGGLLDVLFGIIFLSNPLLTAATLPFIVGLWVIFYGVMTLSNSFQLRKEGSANWWLQLIGGALAVLVGFIISGNIAAGTLVITFWMGTGFLLAGVVHVFAALGIRSLKSRLDHIE